MQHPTTVPQSEKSHSEEAPQPSSSPSIGSAETHATPLPMSQLQTTATAPLPSDRSNYPNQNPTPADLPLHALFIDPTENDRVQNTDDEIAALALQIAQAGLINPITVEPSGDKYRVIAGRRRLLAVRKLGWTSVPVTVRTCTDRQRATIKLAENVARSNLSPLEEAHQIGPLLELYRNDLHALATALGRSTSWIQDRIDMAAWPDGLLLLVHEKKLTLAVAKRLARVPNPKQRDYLIEQAKTYGCNAQTAALWLRDALSAPQSDTELSENNPLPHQTIYRTKTECQCFRCNEYRELTNTIPARICHGCIKELGVVPNLAVRETPAEADPPCPQPTT